MRKIKSTALLGAFVAVASLGVISHEAHGATLTSIVNNIPKEMLPGYVSLPTPTLTSSVAYSQTNATITLTLSGASFAKNYNYAILGNSSTVCYTSESYSGLNSLTLSNCGPLTANASYTIVGGTLSPYANNTSFTVYGSQGTSSIVLSYSSNIGNDNPSSVTLAQVMPQLSVSAYSNTQAVISPTSLTAFTNGFTSATNAVVISNSAFGNSTWSNTINVSDTISFLFTGIPSSVTLVSATDTTAQTAGPVTPGNASATVSFVLASNSAPFQSASSDKIYFGFSNSGNIQAGTIVLSSITGIAPISGASNYVYLSTPQNFINFTFGGTEIYIPDALAHSGSNVIQYSYITISMPSSASIASISVLNVSGASCPAPSLANGLLQSTSTTGVYYIDLGQLAQSCTGISPVAWQSGVPLVINITGTNATPNNITADAYAVFGGMLKRIPVNVISLGSSSTAQFSY